MFRKTLGIYRPVELQSAVGFLAELQPACRCTAHTHTHTHTHTGARDLRLKVLAASATLRKPHVVEPEQGHSKLAIVYFP
jgi:hypothetical protein